MQIPSAPMARLFHTVPISLTHFFLIGGVASSVLWTEELRKWFARRKIQNAPQVG